MITALLVSVNYSDYLEVVLPCNTFQFDQIIVLTIESDKECQDLCSKYSNVKCLVFPDEILKKSGKAFNKGAIINKGFQYLNEIGYQDWLVMTDSDIIFPENFKELMSSKEKDPNVIYGMERRHCLTKSVLNEYLKSRDINILIHDAPWFDDLGAGFCQIFMYKANKFTFFENDNADASDLKFVKQYFGHEEAAEILTISDFVVHLGLSWQNWWGRRSELFK